MTGVIAVGLAPWIPVAHRMELIRTDEPPAERELTTAAFVLAFDARDRLLLTHVNLPGRGWDVPGGHIDPGENGAQAAVREMAEETGFEVAAENLSIVGWQRFTLLDVPPTNYPYPFPLSYTLIFTMRTHLVAPPVRPQQDSECGPAQWCAIDQVTRRCGHCTWLPFVRSVLDD